MYKRFDLSPLFMFLVSVVLVCLSFWAGRHTSKPCVTAADTVLVVDTQTYYFPIAKDSVVVRYVTRIADVDDDGELCLEEDDREDRGDREDRLDRCDSLGYVVKVPITQKFYDGEEYEVWVSGYEPYLDSIRVFPKTTVIHERSYKPPNKWHIGITGGYGYGFKSKHAEPYIGIGITYSIISF